MNIDSQREILIGKNEAYGYIEREQGIHDFLMGDVPKEHGEKYIRALEYLLERLSTPIEDWDILLGRVVEGPIPFRMEPLIGGGWSHADNPFHVNYRQAGHVSLDYGSLLREGLSGIKAYEMCRCQSRAKKAYRFSITCGHCY